MISDKNYPEDVRQLRQEQDFLRYLKLLKKIEPNYLIFITVSDTGAGPYFLPEHAVAMAELGLKINMLHRYRQPYIAIINHGKVVREMCSEKLDEPLTFTGKINNHDLYIYSAGFNCQSSIGMGAVVMFDGVPFGVGNRGFDFLVFDTEEDEIVDARGFDTFNLAKCNTATNSFEPALMSFVQKYGGGYNFAQPYCLEPHLKAIQTSLIGNNGLSSKRIKMMDGYLI